MQMAIVQICRGYCVDAIISLFNIDTDYILVALTALAVLCGSFSIKKPHLSGILGMPSHSSVSSFP
jgi:hypothetical protein